MYMNVYNKLYMCIHITTNTIVLNLSDAPPSLSSRI